MSEVTKPVYVNWAAPDDEILIEMAKAGATFESVAEATGRSVFAVARRARRLGVSFAHKFPQVKYDQVNPDSYEARVRANIMHLVDLKRAGHSPRFTEFKITSDDMIPNRSISPQPAFSPSSCALVW